MGWRGLVVAATVLVLIAVATYIFLNDGALPLLGEEVTPTPEATLGAIEASPQTLAEARVVPAQHARLAFGVAGRVREVLVAEGEEVGQGEVMIRLDSAQQAASLLQAEADLRAAQAELARLEAGASSEQLAAAVAAREAAIAAAEAAAAGVTGAGASLAKLRAGATAEEIAIAERRVEEAKNLLWGAQAQRDSICGQVGKYGVEQADCDSAEAAVGQAWEAVQIGDLELQRVRSGTRSEDELSGQAALGRAQGERRAAEARVGEADAALARLLAGASGQELAVARARVDQARATLELTNVLMDQTALRAPFRGTVALVDVVAGETVTPATPVLTLADLTSYQFETEDLTELNVVSVSVGDPATIAVDALPDEELSGRVTHIRPIGEDRLGDVVYKVIVVPDERDERLRWNMTATVDIRHE